MSIREPKQTDNNDKLTPEEIEEIKKRWGQKENLAPEELEDTLVVSSLSMEDTAVRPDEVPVNLDVVAAAIDEKAAANSNENAVHPAETPVNLEAVAAAIDEKPIDLEDTAVLPEQKNIVMDDTAVVPEYTQDKGSEAGRAAANGAARTGESAKASAEGTNSASAKTAKAPSRSSGASKGSDMKKASVKKKKKSKKALIIILVIVGVLVILGGIYALMAKKEVGELKAQAHSMKDELKTCVAYMKDMNTEGVDGSINNISTINKEMQERLEKPFWKITALVPYYGQDVKTAKNLLTTLDSLTGSILVPFSNLIKEYPLDALKAGDGMLNVNLIIHYLDFLDSVDPELTAAGEALSNVDFKVSSVSFQEYEEKIAKASDALLAFEKYKKLLRAFIGNGENRVYLIMAQNSAEIRASGGFPGSIGSIRIQDGILSIGDFNSVYNVLYAPIVPESGITDREVELYQYMYANQAHDACFNPHFAKVGHITKVAYEILNGEYCSGIVSLTPQIIQEILAVTGNSFVLSDGTYLDGTNATSIIERDLYLRYQNDDTSAKNNNSYVDALFSETASAAMGAMFNNLGIGTILDYIKVMQKGFDDRTVMLYLADEAGEAACVEAGCSGNLNSDPMKPVAGVYFSCYDPSKLGMFLEINPEIVSQNQLPDGSTEYQIQVVFRNYLDEVGYNVSSTYILGNYGGSIASYMYFFAPAGGTVSDFSFSDGQQAMMSDYEGLQVGYNLSEVISPGAPLTVTYRVTTAAGAEPLRIQSTPTLQNFR